MAGSPPVLVVPIRSFVLGKARLAGVLDATARHALVVDMATRVVGAAGNLTVVVVSDDAEVIAFARAAGAHVLPDGGSLDASARAGREWARAHGADRVVVAHADLPHARDLERLAADGAAPVAVIVPDHRRDGTPVLSVPADGPFEFAYGPGSFVRHCDAARAAGFAVRVDDDPLLAFDVDDADDLAALRAEACGRDLG